MSGKTFVDTNVFVYAVDEAEPAKRDIAQRVLASGQYGEFVLSSQILSEFYVTITRKLTECVSEAEAAQALERLRKYPTVSIDVTLVKRAIQISRSAKLSYWDGLVVAAADRAGCGRLLTEDLNDGQEINSVRVENPFRDAT
ncbi:MAG: PIN domain-containing protein [Solirubrobacteraceae bacterium]